MLGHRKMTEQEKSLALAKLMGWELSELYIIQNPECPVFHQYLEPYNDSTIGYAQFAAILLKYPEVMTEVCVAHYDLSIHLFEPEEDGRNWQGFILDEVLRMKGVKVWVSNYSK